jgi:hypothetical protein
LCAKEEEFFKGTATTPPFNKFNYHRLQLSQVPLWAISSSYYFCNMVLVGAIAYVITCGERENDVTTLI